MTWAILKAVRWLSSKPVFEPFKLELLFTNVWMLKFVVFAFKSIDFAFEYKVLGFLSFRCVTGLSANSVRTQTDSQARELPNLSLGVLVMIRRKKQTARVEALDATWYVLSFLSIRLHWINLDEI